ncbi:hypothetical protein [Endozoicomonas euniceicola]|uniref:Uncharacterized protein n=1 Tax=Endozoicomonas euniceicola TaxID=1234143 RepID=A0ABY6GRQ2_9GAMM|nr:hypothetical protein [Endozoicomonas euniceicola]UYM15427.1 hypothetical protein NX720_21665 [Endozoicomonas euniceicola]
MFHVFYVFNNNLTIDVNSYQVPPIGCEAVVVIKDGCFLNFDRLVELADIVGDVLATVLNVVRFPSISYHFVAFFCCKPNPGVDIPAIRGKCHRSNVVIRWQVDATAKVNFAFFRQNEAG